MIFFKNCTKLSYIYEVSFMLWGSVLQMNIRNNKDQGDLLFSQVTSNYFLNNTIYMQIFIPLILCFVLTYSTVIITNPTETQFPQNQIDYMYGNFGEIPYGKSLSVELVIINSSLCKDISEIDHFTKPTYMVIKSNIQDTCSYTKKALVAQERGAKGIMIASSSYDYASGNVFMGDDGNGKKVHITTLFISDSSYQKLSSLPKVQIIARYPVPKQPISTISIFLSASKRSSYLFLRQLQQEYKSLKDSISIEPVYHSVTCESCSQENCLLDSYCSFDYEDYVYKVGQYVLKQQLRQQSLFKNKGVETWLNYMNQFDEYCMGDWLNSQTCSGNVLKKIGVEKVVLGNPEQTLRSWKIKQYKMGFDNFPEIAINGMIYRGNFDYNEIIDAVCQSLIYPPSHCSTRYSEENEQQAPNNHASTILIVMISSLFILILLVGCLYRKLIKRELTNDMASRVGQLVATYANSVAKQQKNHKNKLIQSNDEEL